MTKWTNDHLDKIGKAEEVQIAPFRRDGPAGEPVTVWIVRHGDDLYVRSVRGATVIGSGVHRRGTRVGYEPVVFRETSHSSTPTTTSTTKSMLPIGPSTADTPEACSTVC